jgi:hypothetical protein
MLRIFSLALSCLIFQGIWAQQLNNDSLSAIKAANYIKHIYNTQREDDLPVFNGTQHYPYSSLINGVAYFQSDSWQKGAVIYEDVLYHDILMKYDLVADKIIIAPLRGGIFISLFGQRVKEFSFSGLKFIRIDKTDKTSPPSGFYEVLVEGKTTLLIKTTKTISERIIDNALYSKFEQKVKYYILKNNQYYPVNNKKSLLDILKEKRKAVLDFITQKGLNYRRDTKNTIHAAVEFYNQ